MAKVESLGGGLIPVALVAGVLSGAVFRTSTPQDPPKPTPRPAAAAGSNESDAPQPAPRLSDLRPVMELLGQALGDSVQPDGPERAGAAYKIEVEAPGKASTSELTPERQRLKQFLDAGKSQSAVAAETPDSTRDRYLHAEFEPAARLHKLRSKTAERLFDDFRDAALLRKLTADLRPEGKLTFDVRFLVATVPDYVDSNSGWVADEVIGAIQAAMGRAEFLLDRFRLIDWSRADPAHADGVINDSRLHERQPGALIFRKVDSGRRIITLEVVLLVLETPTGGVHRAALRNALHFVRLWQTTVDPDTKATVKIVAPIFSGSVMSLALELRKWEGPPESITLVSGSAMADENPGIVRAFTCGVDFRAAVQPTSLLMKALKESLGRMNPAWGEGHGVALLVEGNTSFGNSANPARASSNSSSGPPPCPLDDVPSPRLAGERFDTDFVYPFPLHVAQLRNDSQSQPTPTVSLLPTPIVPLNFRESTPPSDQLPALRPQLTSPVAEATVSAILDNIRHENVSAVGIVATDARDVLFLAREIKRGAPDVQLFLASSYLLYLHPQYIPYMRGAIAASPYPLTLNARDANRAQRGRQPFQSHISEGVFNATLMQLGAHDKLVDYCDPAAKANESNKTSCVPPVWVSVIGDDGYWPINRRTESADFVPVITGSAPTHHQIPMTSAAGLAAYALLMVVVFLFASAIWLLWPQAPGQRHFRDSYARVLAPPVSFRSTGFMHGFMLLVATVCLACVSAWFAAVLVVQRAAQAGMLEGGTRPPVAAIVSTVFAIVMAPGVALAWQSFRADATSGLPRPDGPQAPRPWYGHLVILCSVGLMVATVAGFVAFIRDTIQITDVATTGYSIERIVAGGIVSPAPITICLFGALLAGTLAGLRRLSMVGNGYTALADNSPAFRLLAGMSPECAGAAFSAKPDSTEPASRDLRHFAALLDMPVQNLRLPYLVAILAAIGVVIVTAGRVSTVDGRAFSFFVSAASLSILVTSLLLVLQSVATWSELKPKLSRLARKRLDRALSSVGDVIRWDLSIVSPRLSELMPLVSRAERLRGAMLGIATAHLQRSFAHGVPNRRAPQDTALLQWYESSLGVRPNDLMKLSKGLFDEPSVDVELRDEILDHKASPLLQSRTWFRLWRISDLLVTALEQVYWKRCGGAPCEGTPDAEASTAKPRTPDHTRDASQLTIDRWFSDSEEFIALQYAFLLRDVLARIMSSLFAAMVCLTLLTAAHLFYLFQGRSSLLTVDLVAIGIAAVAAIQIVVGMERDTVLSLLRSSNPGRIDFNWDFIKRVAVYGVLPLLAVIGSLFPEIGDSFFGWLEPIRKLASF
ncbi:MAG TPA: hypothetical protein VH497_08455 [Vicinamibacterales bacterium]